MPRWTVSDQAIFTFDDAEITDLRVRIVGGAVNIVPTDGPARLEISEVTGPPLIVRQEGPKLTVAYDDLRWGNLLKWIEDRSWKRRAVVSVAVPRKSRAKIGVVSGDAVVTGLHGRVEVSGVSGDLTLAQLPGDVDLHSVSGRITARGIGGRLKTNTVSGELTVFEGGGDIEANTVSGPLTVDVAETGAGAPRITLNTVSGEIAIRIPDPTDASVEANTTGGNVTSAFDELRVHSGFGPKHLTGRLGSGSGRLRITSVSGSITVLKRPVDDGAPEDATDAPHSPEDGGGAENEGKTL